MAILTAKIRLIRAAGIRNIARSPPTSHIAWRFVLAKKSSNDGRLIVQVNTGSNWKTIAKDKFKKGSIAVQSCYKQTPQVRVKNDKNDAWTGSIMMSSDLGRKWSPLFCDGCTKTGLTNNIVVDGNSDSKNQADTHCWNKRTCTLTTDVPKVCADGEGKTCKCNGTVYFGKKFAGGKPGNGRKATFDEMTRSNHKKKSVSGEIKCANNKLGDPTPGFYKQCWCQEN
jgi:hypothetical protein